MRGQGQRLRPTAERKASYQIEQGENMALLTALKANHEQGSWCGSASPTNHTRELIRGQIQGRLRGPYGWVESCKLRGDEKRAKERIDGSTRAISRSNHPLYR